MGYGSARMRGDYGAGRGDYGRGGYRGGLFSFVKKAAKVVGGAAAGFVRGGVTGAITGGIAAASGRSRPPVLSAGGGGPPGINISAGLGSGSISARGFGGGAASASLTLPGFGGAATGGKRRHINPTNPRALRRAITRMKSFRKLAARMESTFPKRKCTCKPGARRR